MRKISVGWLEIGEKEKKAVNDVLDSGRISEGPVTAEFEKKWAEFIGTRYCLTTSSGTAALITVLTAFKHLYDLEKRPKVITSPLTYISDANAIVLSGLEPVFVDIDPETFCITPEAIENHLSQVADPEKYSILLPVDLIGYSVKIDEIKRIAQKYDLLVLEDAAEAHGTMYKGKCSGADAHAGIYSFYIAHNIQAGEMGAITTNDEKIFTLCKQLKANGRFCECTVCTRAKGVCPGLQSLPENEDFDPRFLHEVIGYNFKTMEFQPAIALAQMENIPYIIKRRQENIAALNKGLEEFADILQLPLHDENVSYLAYPLVIKNTSAISRKKLRKELEEHGVETRPLFGCIPTQQPAYEYMRKAYQGRIPHAEYAGANGFYIGCHQYLTDEDIAYTISIFKKILGETR
ncbi:MAG: DegT/DnrJ/EryC1/StrS family aminotransferase [PVC group bacterium]|nr:DegT/DnrJ/EryC1/StrS family aminotransferase [PVC group bacterium]